MLSTSPPTYHQLQTKHYVFFTWTFTNSLQNLHPVYTRIVLDYSHAEFLYKLNNFLLAKFHPNWTSFSLQNFCPNWISSFSKFIQIIYPVYIKSLLSSDKIFIHFIWPQFTSFKIIPSVKSPFSSGKKHSSNLYIILFKLVMLAFAQFIKLFTHFKYSTHHILIITLFRQFLISSHNHFTIHLSK